MDVSLKANISNVSCVKLAEYRFTEFNLDIPGNCVKLY